MLKQHEYKKRLKQSRGHNRAMVFGEMLTDFILHLQESHKKPANSILTIFRNLNGMFEAFAKKFPIGEDYLNGSMFINFVFNEVESEAKCRELASILKVDFDTEVGKCAKDALKSLGLVRKVDKPRVEISKNNFFEVR